MKTDDGMHNPLRFPPSQNNYRLHYQLEPLFILSLKPRLAGRIYRQGLSYETFPMAISTKFINDIKSVYRIYLFGNLIAQMNFGNPQNQYFQMDLILTKFLQTF